MLALSLRPTNKSAEIDLIFLGSCFAISIFGFVAGFILPSLKKNEKERFEFIILWDRVNILLMFSLLILLYNVYDFGLLPIAKILGEKTAPYNEYGRFKGAYFPILGALIVFSLTELRNKIGYGIVGILGFLLYMSRGPLIFYAVEGLIFWCLWKNLPIAKMVKIFFISICLIVLGNGLMGNIRSGSEGLINQMGVTDTYQEYGSVVNWTLSYVATPISNFVHIKDCAYSGGIDFITRAMPAFFNSKTELSCGKNELIIDEAHFYLFYWYLWAGGWGILAVNFIYGVCTGIARGSVYYFAPALTCVVFIFFGDILLFFQTFFHFFAIWLCVKNANKN